MALLDGRAESKRKGVRITLLDGRADSKRVGRVDAMRKNKNLGESRALRDGRADSKRKSIRSSIRMTTDCLEKYDCYLIFVVHVLLLRVYYCRREKLTP